MKQFKLDPQTYIGGWYIPKKVCNDLLLWRKKNKHREYIGKFKRGSNNTLRENTDIKESVDLEITPNELVKSTLTKPYGDYLQKCLEEYIKLYPDSDKIDRYVIYEPFNLQHYPVGGGYKEWHCECGNKNATNRVLVYMTYLNDVSDGGTHFRMNDIITPAEKGLTLIWPAYWPWHHKGQISQTCEKNIITGWYGFV